MELRKHQKHELAAPHLLQNVAPTDIAAVLAILEDEDADFTKLAKLIQNRPAIATVIIRAVNAVLNGNQQPVQSLKHALSYLGLERTRQTLRSLQQTQNQFAAPEGQTYVA